MLFADRIARYYENRYQIIYGVHRIVRYETEAEMLKLADRFVGLLNEVLDELGIGTTQQYYVQE